MSHTGMSCVYSENVIVEYQQKVKLLEEENKKLEEENEDNLASLNFYTEQCAELKDERKKLKNDLRLCAEGLIPKDLIQLGIVEDLRGKVKQLEEKNEELDWIIKRERCEYHELDENKNELIAENKKLKEDLEKAWDQRGDKWRKARIKKLTEENEKLKEENKKLEGEAEQNQQLFDTTFGELMKLKEEKKKQKKEHVQNIMKTKRIATELYREMKYALGYGEFDEPDRKVMYEEIKKLKEESKVDKEFQEEVMQENKKLKEREYEMCQIANANGWDIYPTDSEEEEDSDDPDEE